MYRKPFWVGVGLSLFIVLASRYAAAQGLLAEPGGLGLSDKIGRIYNFIDNPAYLAAATSPMLEEITEVRLTSEEPGDPVFRKSAQDDRFDCLSRVICPFGKVLAVSLGGRYCHHLQSSQSISKLDGTYTREANRLFQREVRAGLAIPMGEFLSAGYAFAEVENDHTLGFASDFATPYVSRNAEKQSGHTLGILARNMELFAAYSSVRYQGSYDGTREADFSFDQITLSARCLVGEVERENLVAKISFTDSILGQQIFSNARSCFWLDYSNWRASVQSYYYLPEDSWEGAAGVELYWEDRMKFEIGNYRWINYRTYSVCVPLRIRAPLNSFLRLWVEMDFKCSAATFQSVRQVFFENTCGLVVVVSGLEVDFYTLPFLVLASTSENQACESVFGLGVRTRFRF